MNHLFLALFLHFFAPQPVITPSKPTDGPGSERYTHEAVWFQDYAQTEKGYWLFEPTTPTKASAPVVVFLHGYGAYNPMVYGAWIRHLVKQGNIVIYPRYQTNIFTPSASKFARNSAIAIQDALEVLQKDGHTTPDTTHFTLVGHSYGGVISANLAANYEVLGIPKPTVAMLCSPGSGPLSGGVLKNYEKLPNDLKLLVIVTENDQVVGDKFGKLVFETAPQVKHRNYIVQKADLHSSEEYIKAGHNETYALDMEFDAGIRNMTIKRALMTAREDHADYYCYWKLLDALMDYDQTGINYEFAFNQEAPQVNMGTWSDGSKILPLEVLLP